MQEGKNERDRGGGGGGGVNEQRRVLSVLCQRCSGRCLVSHGPRELFPLSLAYSHTWHAVKLPCLPAERSHTRADTQQRLPASPAVGDKRQQAQTFSPGGVGKTNIWGRTARRRKYIVYLVSANTISASVPYHCTTRETTT